MRELTGLLGPYPYQALTVVALPSLRSGGIEYPGGFFTGPEPQPPDHQLATRSLTSGSTGWRATTRHGTRGSTSPLRPSPRQSPTGS